nr:hypothetical protein CFP56_71261 [Quercus suber]
MGWDTKNGPATGFVDAEDAGDAHVVGDGSWDGRVVGVAFSAEDSGFVDGGRDEDMLDRCLVGYDLRIDLVFCEIVIHGEVVTENQRIASSRSSDHLVVHGGM